MPGAVTLDANVSLFPRTAAERLTRTAGREGGSAMLTADENSRRRAKKRGDAIRALDDHALIDLAGIEGVPYERDAAIAELQRRGADVMIGLTKRISWLTFAILMLTVVLAVVEVVGCLGTQP